jgi:CheY-like chemotaxis protein
MVRPVTDRQPRQSTNSFFSLLSQGTIAGLGVIPLPHRNLILVVGRRPRMLRGAKRLLREHGFVSVLFASAVAFQNHNDFETALCVILDINLNDGSAIELRRRLKADGVSVPVIYITRNDNPAVRKAALESGCIALLNKPFSAKSLIGPLKMAPAGLPPRVKTFFRNGSSFSNAGASCAPQVSRLFSVSR